MRLRIFHHILLIELIVVFHVDGASINYQTAQNIIHAFRSKPSLCISTRGKEGVCMFHQSCIQNNGTTNSACMMNYLIGACCESKTYSDPIYNILKRIKLGTDKYKPTSGVATTEYSTESSPTEEVSVAGAIFADSSTESRSTTDDQSTLSTWQTVTDSMLQFKVEPQTTEFSTTTEVLSTFGMPVKDVSTLKPRPFTVKPGKSTPMPGNWLTKRPEVTTESLQVLELSTWRPDIGSEEDETTVYTSPDIPPSSVSYTTIHRTPYVTMNPIDSNGVTEETVMTPLVTEVITKVIKPEIFVEKGTTEVTTDNIVTQPTVSTTKIPPIKSTVKITAAKTKSTVKTTFATTKSTVKTLRTTTSKSTTSIPTTISSTKKVPTTAKTVQITIEPPTTTTEKTTIPIITSVRTSVPPITTTIPTTTVRTTRPPTTTTVRTTVPPIITTEMTTIPTTTTVKTTIPTTTAPPSTTSDASLSASTSTNTISSTSGGAFEWGYRKNCGIRPLIERSSATGRIVGGKPSTFGQYPWQALIISSKLLGLIVKNKCGGVLIGQKHVLTAAHCQPGLLETLKVRLGEHDIRNNWGALKSMTVGVVRMIVHRDYNALTFENDIGILELAEEVKLLPHIYPICLPPPQVDYTGRIGLVSGWGKLRHGGKAPNILQYVALPIIENKECQKWFLAAGRIKEIVPSFMCAGFKDGGQDSCEGDSGGPLMLQEASGKWTLGGIVSHGINCAAPNLPGVYTRMTHYLEWILSIAEI